MRRTLGQSLPPTSPLPPGVTQAEMDKRIDWMYVGLLGMIFALAAYLEYGPKGRSD